METISLAQVEDWGKYFYYDHTSPSRLRWNVDRFHGVGHAAKFISVGDPAGGLDKDGYYVLNLNRKAYKAHRVIYNMFVGEIPENFVIDHIDGVKSNNCIDNLRVVPHSLNMRNMKQKRNNTSGVTGVSLLRNTNRSGSISLYWGASCLSTSGLKIQKRFSVAKYGNDEAFRMACEYRVEVIAHLNTQGAEYTERHGNPLINL